MTSMQPLAALLTIVQAITLTAVSVYAGLLGLTATAGDEGVAMLIVAVALVCGCWGLFMLTGGIGMTGRRRWGRIPTTVAEIPLVLAPVRFGFGPITVMALALPAAVVLFAIATTAGHDPHSDWV